MRNFMFMILALAVILFCGFAPFFYSYKDVRYDIKKGAIQAQQEDLNQISRQIPSKKEPLYDNALLILLSHF